MEIYSGKKHSFAEKDEEEEELYEFQDDDDNEEIESDAELSASDIEDEQDDSIPDQKAWGKKRVQYYDADFIDKDYSTYTKEEEDLALAEEEEAQEIQKRLAQQLNDIDCDLEFFDIKKDTSTKKIHQSETKFKVDFSNLDNRQKLQLFKKESPEFDGLISDFENNLNDLSEFYSPLLNYAKSNKLHLPIFKVLHARTSATNFYLTNLAFYLYMKVKKVQFKGHPIVKKLAQIKKLLNELDIKIENSKPQLMNLLQKIENNEDFICCAPQKYINERTEKYSKYDMDNENDDLNEEENEDFEAGDERRGITYQIAKNKGLMPHRKKENRNPRVKNKMKFRKALIRRKGAIRTVRKETKRYDGELSGIKATVRKSIKFK